MSDDRPPGEHPLLVLLQTVANGIGIDRIDRLWIFPPRRREAGETAVVIVAAFLDDEPGRRRVHAARYTAPADAPDPVLALDEFGTAPVERVGRVVEDVLERIKDEPATAPHAARIDGRTDHWARLLHDLADQHLRAATRDPRRFHEPPALRSAPARPPASRVDPGGGAG